MTETNIGDSKRGWCVDYAFWEDGEYYSGCVGYGSINHSISIDSMKQMKCVEIKCSFISSSLNDLTDQRVLAKD